jgi:cyclic pyranopterin phosphate synthase
MSHLNSKSLEQEEQVHSNPTYVDEFGRSVDYLRISLTQRCNYSCFFCHHEGEKETQSEMTFADIERIVYHASKHGIHHLKLTGGEPLLREDILKIVKMVSPLMDDLSMTTNGERLEDLASDLKTAGLSRINVSLHSLNKETYHRITGTDNLEVVKRGIQKAVEAGLSPVKINVTVLRGYNDNEIREMMEFAADMRCTLQLIELQQMQDDDTDISDLRVNLDVIESEISKVAIRTEKRHLNGRNQYVVPLAGGREVTVEIVKPMHNSAFCDECTRLRITSDGKLKPCLLRNDNLVEIAHDDEVILNDESLDLAFRKAVKNREPYWRDERDE